MFNSHPIYLSNVNQIRRVITAMPSIPHLDREFVSATRPGAEAPSQVSVSEALP